MTGPIKVLDAKHPLPVHDIATTRRIEAEAAAALAPQTLMARAGWSVARLCLAVAPEARHIVVAVGPGNNGGDGLVAARHLHEAGKRVTAVMAREGSAMPDDARNAFDAARAAGVKLVTAWPSEPADLVVDAMLGIGASGHRTPTDALQSIWSSVASTAAPIVAVDVPSGLDAASGVDGLMGPALRASHTLALLTLKPGLLTGAGRDACGTLWFDDLGVTSAADHVAPSFEALVDRTDADAPIAWLGTRPALGLSPTRNHADHKGSFGDVIVVGGAAGMQGALALAARGALRAGAGRVYAVPLAQDGAAIDGATPEIMVREPRFLERPAWLEHATVVCGCGGGDEVRGVLPRILSSASRLVLDADGLNAVARDPSLQALLQARTRRGLTTVLTPHPLEAARLLGLGDAHAVQSDRVGFARQLAQRFDAIVVLKGSGSLTTARDRSMWINASGNDLLATAGTGDVLAGWIGGRWSAGAGGIVRTSWGVPQLVARAVWEHGAGADRAKAAGQTTMSASALIEWMAGV